MAFTGLIVHSMEIGRALAERDRAVLHAKGMCMVPLVRPGDLLHIQQRGVDQVAVGDIAVYRQYGRLVCHRVVDRGTLNGRPYIVTRSDRNNKSNDPFTYDEDLLGIVTSIERNGRRMNPYDSKNHSRIPRFSALYPATIEFYYYWRERIVAALASVQGSWIYRSVTRLLLASSRRSARYEIRVWKESWRKLGLYMPLKPEEFDIGGPVLQGCTSDCRDCWTLALHLDSGNQPAAQATFLPGPENWRLDGFHVRSRYRGMGLEKDLLSKAKEIFNRNGIVNFDLNGLPLE